jgi:PAS domain S-box-containing protein
MDIKSILSSKEQDIFKALFDAAPDAMVIVDRKGYVLMVNWQTEKLFGYLKNELIGHPVELLMPEAIRVDHNNNRKFLKEPGVRSTDVRLELEAIRKDGTKFPVEISLSRLQTQKGNLERKKLENQIKSTNAEVETLQKKETEGELTERLIAGEHKEFEQRAMEALINSTDDLIWSVSSDLKLIASNQAFVRIVESIVGVTVKPGDEVLMSDFFPGNIVAIWKEAYDRALSGETFKKETYMPASDKLKESWTETTFNPIYNNETVVGLTCFSKNITERKIAEERIRQSESHLAEAQGLAKLGSWDYDIITQKLTVSEESYNVFGIHKPAFIETHGSFIDLIDAEDREFVRQIRRHVIKTGNPYSIEYHITTTEGGKRVIREQGYGQTDDNGETVRLVGIAQDITESKIVEKTLVESENYLRTIIQTEPHCVKLLGINGALKSMNASGLEMLEADSLEQVIGKSILRVINKPYRKAFKHLIQNVFTGKSGTLEFEITALKGTHRWMETHAVPLRNAEGKIISLLGISLNVTERKNAEKEMLQINEELRSLSSHLQNVREDERIQIARDIHDELGQQLTGLKMDANWLYKKMETQDEIVKQKMNDMIELIDETLKSVRRISSNLRPSILDDFGLIAALEWHSGEVAKRSEIKVNFSTDMQETDIPVAMATGIFRIYQELLTNAVRHANADVITSSLRLKDNQIILKIKDDGQGMDLAINRTKKTLGLIGIKERIFALGGKFDLKSEPGKGTKVQISIPYEQH